MPAGPKFALYTPFGRRVLDGRSTSPTTSRVSNLRQPRRPFDFAVTAKMPLDETTAIVPVPPRVIFQTPWIGSVALGVAVALPTKIDSSRTAKTTAGFVTTEPRFPCRQG